MADTWAERDLDEYLRNYARGSDWTERRQRKCMLCGDTFDLADGVNLTIFRNSPIRVNGEIPEYICICNSCYGGAEKIESEDEYEYQIS